MGCVDFSLVGGASDDAHVLVLAFAMFCAAAHDRAAVVPLEDGPVRLGRHLDVLAEEPGARLSPEQAFIATTFTRSMRDEPSFGFGAKTVWARFHVEPQPAAPVRHVIRAGFPRPPRIELFGRDGAGRVRLVAGSTLAGAALAPGPGSDVVLPLEPGITDYVLRVEAQPARLNLELFSVEGLAQQRQREMLFAGLYYGIFVGLFFYNLFLGLSLRDGVHTLYCTFLVCMAIHVAVRDGITPAWGPEFIFKHGGGLSMTSLVMLVFARRFLSLRDGWPRLDVVMRAAMAACAGIFVLALVGVNVPGLSVLSTALAIVVVAACAAVVAAGGDRPARVFVVAWGILIASSMWSLALAAGLSDANVVTRHGLKVGSAVEMVVLSLALAARVNELRTRKEHAELELARARVEAQKELAGRLIEAQEAERSRFARELHDGLGHALLVMKEKLRAAVRASRPIEPAEAERLGDDAQHCIDDARAMARNLVPPALERLGLVQALRAATHDLSESTGVSIELACDDAELAGIDDVLDGRAIHVYRVAQEALANAVRHGAPSEVRLALAREDNVLTLTIEDDGRGFVRGGASGLGLLDMEQRARLARATLDIVSVPGEGTRIVCRVPAFASAMQRRPAE